MILILILITVAVANRHRPDPSPVSRSAFALRARHLRILIFQLSAIGQQSRAEACTVGVVGYYNNTNKGEKESQSLFPEPLAPPKAPPSRLPSCFYARHFRKLLGCRPDAGELENGKGTG